MYEEELKIYHENTNNWIFDVDPRDFKPKPKI